MYTYTAKIPVSPNFVLITYRDIDSGKSIHRMIARDKISEVQFETMDLDKGKNEFVCIRVEFKDGQKNKFYVTVSALKSLLKSLGFDVIKYDK